MSVEQLKKVLKEEKCTFGLDETLKNIKRGKTSTVFLANDCKASMREKIHHYKKLGKLNIIELEINGHEIGALSKKQFSISVMSF
ncbi:MAG: ribosomal L7Ae/L30e/S12e/Gadd45 family protein [bacterium]|nr:ribosomal L7Ae/L30e/S12e/Gadd45 family protein [bacterium]